MSLVEATAAHADALAAIHAAAFPPAERWDARAMAELLAMPGCFGLIHPAGGLALARVAADEAEILTLAVMPGARRQGVAASLLSAVLGRTAPAAVFLEVAAGNGAALALYQGHGFTRRGLRRAYYPDGSDAIVLARA